MKPSLTLAQVLFPVLALLCLLPQISAAVALLLGVTAALLFGNPYLDRTRRSTSTLLGWSVMGLGAGMNLEVVAKVGLHGIAYTVIGITVATVIGTLLGKLLKTDPNTSLLVTMGTAICGGSAIAAIAPTIRAKHNEVSVSLGTVFILNAVALFVFPGIGHYFHLDETQFGLWSALAIHDTSSVVGATLQYGPHAVEVGTTVKLARALWIVPVTLVISWIYSKQNQGTHTEKAKKPWFILGFLIAAALVTWIPSLTGIGHSVEMVAKRFLVLTLFLIGSGLTKETLKSVGIRPLVQGIVLWIVMGAGTLTAILTGLID